LPTSACGTIVYSPTPRPVTVAPFTVLPPFDSMLSPTRIEVGRAR
jgi:hypothetical protein